MKATRTEKRPTQTSQLRDRCLRHFATLRIPVEAAALDEVLALAEKDLGVHPKAAIDVHLKTGQW